MNIQYTNEKNIQILLGLLKAHNIKKVIVSPGTTNVSLVACMQYDSFFELYSAADERSAAYMACGMAEESGEPVVITCTGATASRNYIPGLTEAYYRKLPVLAITATQIIGRVGQNVAQVIDRSVIQNDIAKLSVQLPVCHSTEDEWACNVNVNRALLELTRNGGGPVHINMETVYSNDFSVESLPEVRTIFRVEHGDILPTMPEGKIGIFVGAHSKWNDELTEAVDRFCLTYNAVVLCDQTSNYRGKYRVLCALPISQSQHTTSCNHFDLLIHIGNVSGAYLWFNSKAEWRVNPDGEVRDTFGNLTYVFQMNEVDFFKCYDALCKKDLDNSFLHDWQDACDEVKAKLPTDLPFSNIWLASQIAPKLPKNSIVHLGILNTLRSWNFYETPSDVLLYCNTGGFGIDGVLSTAIGAALCSQDKIVYCVIGDLAFFYDMNSLGNRHLPHNLRVLLINNGKGTEFRNYSHRCARFGNDADLYMAAAGHYGNKSNTLVQHYAEDLGVEYFAIHSWDKAEGIINILIDSEKRERPMLVEAFIDSEDESNALFRLCHLIVDEKEPFPEGRRIGHLESRVRNALKTAIGNKGVGVYRNLRYGKNRET